MKKLEKIALWAALIAAAFLLLVHFGYLNTNTDTVSSEPVTSETSD